MGFQIGPFYIGGVADAQKKAVLDAAPELPFNFLPGSSEVTKRSPFGFLSGRYAHDAVESKIGHGRHDYNKARKLLESWEHFNLGWAYTNAPKIDVGAPVIVVARSLGLWTINPLRIRSKASSRKSMSFTHRTLVGHQISGEERFTLELRKDGSVWYGVDTVSRPDTILATLSLPILRMYQQKFKEDSLRRMHSLLLHS